MTALADAEVARAAALAAADPDPGPAEAWLLGWALLNLAAYLAWARLWRWW